MHSELLIATKAPIYVFIIYIAKGMMLLYFSQCTTYQPSTATMGALDNKISARKEVELFSACRNAVMS